MGRVAEKVKEELFGVLPPTLFFFVTLNMISLVRALMLEGTGIPISRPAQVAVASLVLGKAVLLADMLPLINRYPDKPLVYNVAWKTAIYVCVSFVIHYLEHLIDYWKETGGFLAANHKLLQVMVWPHFWAIQIVLTVLIFWYSLMHEFTREIGREKAMGMFFGRPHPSSR